MNSTHTDVHARAILVSPRFSSWSASKYDKQVSEEAAAAHGAKPEVGRYIKKMLPGSSFEVPATPSPAPSLPRSGRMTKAQKAAAKAARAEHKKQQAAARKAEKELRANSHEKLASAIAAVRVWVNEQTLPWTDDGWRILPIANYDPFMATWRKHLHNLEELAEQFFHDYPTLRELAKQALNGMYNPADYPDDIRARYSFDIVPRAVPSEGDYRVELSDSEVKALAKRTAEDVNAAFEAATNDAVKRVFTVLSRIHERLTTTRVKRDIVTKDRVTKKDRYDSHGNLIPAGTVIKGRLIPGGEVRGATFRDTLIDNARELCDVLTRLNVTGNPQLEHFRRETELLAAATEPETLRNDAAVRADTAQRAQGILDAMTATFGAALFKK